MELCLGLPDLKYWICVYFKINFRDFMGATQRNRYWHFNITKTEDEFFT